jgi:hypothetical protein
MEVHAYLARVEGDLGCCEGPPDLSHKIALTDWFGTMVSEETVNR